MKLTEQEKKKIIELIETGKTLPAAYKSKLFGHDDTEFIEATKDCQLIYTGKAHKEDIIAQTPAASFQKIRSFNSDNPFDDDWQNMLIFGDNLQVLKTLLQMKQEGKLKNADGTPGVRLVYIDPPFGTGQEFLGSYGQKAYQDKIAGARFLEFLRKRLVFLRELLSEDGSIYVHLDYHKDSHVRLIMDEIFGDQDFRNEIIWNYVSGGISESTFARKHDTILFYTKSENYIFNPQKEQTKEYKKESIHRDEKGEYVWYIRPGTNPNVPEGVKSYVNKYVQDVWQIPIVNPQAEERETTNNYPTQKPEALLERIIKASSNPGDIVLDCFAGSGTTLAVAEKLGRRWIGVDCGKLAIYTIQKRMLNLTTQIGSLKKDNRRDYERVADFEEHSKSNSKGLFFIYEKARRGDIVITDSFLENLSEFISFNLSSNTTEEFSLICPEDKLKLQKLKPIECKDSKAGEKIIEVGKVRFLISFIQPKEKTEKAKLLKAKEFTLFYAGVYDTEVV